MPRASFVNYRELAMIQFVARAQRDCSQRSGALAKLTTRGRRGITVVLLISLLPLGASAHQSKFEGFLHKVNGALEGANTVLSGRAPLPSVKYEATGIAPQTSKVDQRAAVEVNFPDGRTEQSVGIFNEALPVIDKTLGIIRCMPYRSLPSSSAMAINERAWNSLHPYEVDHGSVRRPGYLYGTPMGQLQYHDEHLCLEVARAVATVPAGNAISLEVTYAAADSGETTRYSYLYRKDYRNVWQLASYDRLSD
jgi:hypothetical protein